MAGYVKQLWLREDGMMSITQFDVNLGVVCEGDCKKTVSDWDTSGNRYLMADKDSATGLWVCGSVSSTRKDHPKCPTTAHVPAVSSVWINPVEETPGDLQWWISQWIGVPPSAVNVEVFK